MLHGVCFYRSKRDKKMKPLFTLAMFKAQVLVEPSKQLKEIIQAEHNIAENPNWPEANQLAIYKRARGFEHGATEKQIQIVVRAVLKPGTAGLRVRDADHPSTLPPDLLLERHLQ